MEIVGDVVCNGKKIGVLVKEEDGIFVVRLSSDMFQKHYSVPLNKESIQVI
ncbi:MAG: hypothetical protein O8C63_08450 [Candidatus Methanoperedens sp.]|nr:hypothetical protein [Candidatus Methanoperedens sp.]